MFLFIGHMQKKMEAEMQALKEQTRPKPIPEIQKKKSRQDLVDVLKGRKER